MPGKAWRVVCRIGKWAAVGIVAVAVLMILYNRFGPFAWREVVVDTSAERIIGASMIECGNHAPVELDITPGRVIGEFPQRCDLSPTILLTTATAQYYCSGEYITEFWPASVRYRIENGRCVSLAVTTPRPEGKIRYGFDFGF